MDWRTHQRIFLPVLATAYCFHFCGTALRALYECVQAGKDTYPGYGKVQIGAVHIIIAGVKVMVTSLGSSGMETCRRLCGGHGYSLSSGIPERWATFTHTTTAEGDNTVMALQVGKALLKLVGAGKNGSLPYLWDPSATLAETCPGSAPADFLQPKVFLHCLRHRACRLAVELASSQRRRREEAGEPAAQALNADLPMVMRAGEAHSELMMAEFFVEGVSHDSVETELRLPLQRLCALFALDTLEKALGDLLEDGYLAGRAPALRAAIDVLLTQIRPDTVALVDAFNHSDYALHSSIGRADGEVYPALWDHAQRATAYLIHTGTDGVVDGWREAIAPMTRQSRL